MKQCTHYSYYGLLVFSCSLLSAMENFQDTLDQFSAGLFIDKKYNLPIDSHSGRLLLLCARTEGIIREKCIKNIIAINKPNIADNALVYVFSSYLYDDKVCYVSYKTKTPDPNENQQLRIFAQAIAKIERGLIEIKDLTPFEKELLEKTRRHDLYLLKKILELHNNSDIQASQPYTLADFFIANHGQWPPSHDDTKIFNPLSGLTVVQAALENRQKSKIDKLTEK